jgi:thiamine phosphate synthase YjbQ (UPF0047 family)
MIWVSNPHMFTLKSFYIGTSKGVDIINIGHDIRGLIRDSRMENGSVTVSCRLPGALIAILASQGKEAQELKSSIKGTLENEFPASIRHLLPSCVTVPVDKGKLVFEPWQEIFLVDFDEGGRRREIVVQLSTEAAPAGQAGPGQPQRRPT